MDSLFRILAPIEGWRRGGGRCAKASGKQDSERELNKEIRKDDEQTRQKTKNRLLLRLESIAGAPFAPQRSLEITMHALGWPHGKGAGLDGDAASRR